MSLDKETARQLGELDRPAATQRLSDLGLMNASGLEQLLAQSGALMRDDPAIGTRLAELARDLAVAADAPVAFPKALYLLAQAKAGAGDMIDALALIDAAREGFMKLGRTTEALRTNLGRSEALNEMGRHDEALDACRDLLAGAATLGDPDDPAVIALVAPAHQNSGVCLELSGRFDEALEQYAAAEVGYASLGDTRALAEVTHDRGLVLLTIGQHGEALVALQRSANAFRDGGYRALLVMALANTAEVQLHRGEYQQCLASLAEASEALEDISAPGGEQPRLLVAASAYLALNLLPEALSSFVLAVELLEGTDLVIELARTRWGQGLALARTGRLDEANDALVAAAEVFERSGQSSWLAEVLVDQARIQRSIGNVDTARQSALSALKVALSGTSSKLRAQLLLAELTDSDAGIGQLQSTVDAANDLGLAPLVAAAYHALGRRLANAGRLEEAELNLHRAVQEVEDLRDSVGHELVLTRFLDDKLSPYEDLLAVLIARGAAAVDALRVGEQAKSRTLSDVVSGLVNRRASRSPASSDSLDADLRAIYGELFSGQVAPDGERSKLLQHRLQSLEAQRDIARLRALPGVATNETPVRTLAPTTTAPGTIAISYACAGDALHAFIVDGESVDMVPNTSTVSAIVGLLDRLRRQWDRFRLGHEVIERHLVQMELATKAVLHDLYVQLIAPLEPLLQNSDSTRMVIVPDTLLHDVPFHALWDGTSYLLDRFEIVYSPSLETLHHLPPRRTGSSVVVGVADELAPLVEHEVAVVASRLADPTMLTGPQATWVAVEGHLASSAHIHLAGHALFRPDNPMYSALKVHDRWVTAADLFGLDLEGATVVLSACETARTQQAHTAEINGFVRAFLGAGASTVVASQWTADDRATTRFMELFYEHLGASNPAGAVRSAQIRVALESPHPYYWAPWIVVGGDEQSARLMP
jgi:tetratricopeptide (TPR) repeat protein